MPTLTSLTSIGTGIQPFPLRLSLVRELCRIGRPLVSLYRSPEGNSYLEVWADRDDEVERWIVFRVDDRDLIAYLHGRLPLKALVTDGADGFVFVKDESAEGNHLAFLPVDELPSGIIPSDESFYDAKYDPSPDMQDEQAILLDGSWEMEGLADVNRTFNQVVAATSCLGSSRPPAVVSLEHRFDHYKFEGGFVRFNVFEKFLEVLPKRPSMREVQYASPGIMRIKVEPKLRGAAKQILRRFNKNFGRLASIFHDMHRQILDQRALDRAGKPISTADKNRLRRNVESLVGELGVIDVNALRFVAKNERAAAEILATFYRKLKKLADWESERRAEFL